MKLLSDKICQLKQQLQVYYCSEMNSVKKILSNIIYISLINIIILRTKFDYIVLYINIFINSTNPKFLMNITNYLSLLIISDINYKNKL